MLSTTECKEQSLDGNVYLYLVTSEGTGISTDGLSLHSDGLNYSECDNPNVGKFRLSDGFIRLSLEFFGGS